MDAGILRDRLYEIIRSVFTRPDLSLSDDTTPADVDGWDSFNHMNLVMRVEEEFGIAFDIEEVGAIGRVKDLYDLISSKIEKSVQ